MNIYLYMNFVLIFLSLVLFCKFHKYFLMSLISLEFLVFSVVFNIYMFKLVEGMGEFLVILYMVMVVCESVIGMIILVNFIMFMGVDSYKVINQLD